MRREVDAVPASCPYCGETIELLIDCSVPVQDYVEDCQVCCRPMTISVSVGEDGGSSIRIRDENDPAGV